MQQLGFFVFLSLSLCFLALNRGAERGLGRDLGGEQLKKFTGYACPGMLFLVVPGELWRALAVLCWAEPGDDGDGACN